MKEENPPVLSEQAGTEKSGQILQDQTGTEESGQILQDQTGTEESGQILQDQTGTEESEQILQKFMAGGVEPLAMDEGIAIDENNFPDEYFRNYLMGMDTDGDGSFSAEELENLTDIYISGKPIKDLTGISLLSNLRTIAICESLLTSVDLSNYTNLITVNFSSNEKLQNVNLDHCSNLTSLSLNTCALSELNLQGCSKLESLECYNARLTALDLKQTPNLTRLYVGYNQLSELDVAKNSELKHLSCGSNPLRKLDISNNPQLEYLDINGTYIASLDTSRNELLKMSYAEYWTTNSSGMIVEMEDGRWQFPMSSQEGFQPEKLKVVDWMDNSNVPEITEQGVIWQKAPVETGAFSLVMAYDLSNGSYLDGKVLRCNYTLRRAEAGYDETYVELTAENFPDEAFRNFLAGQYDWDGTGRFQPGLISDLWISGIAEIKDLTGIGYFKALSSLYLEQNPALTKLDVSGNEKLTRLYISGSPVHSLDLRNNPQIQELNLYNAQITSLYLAEDSLMSSYFCGQPILATAVEENGRYVLDFSEYGGLDSKRVVDLSDGEIDGNKIYWNSAEEVPLTFSYNFLLRGDYETGMEYAANDVFTVIFSLTNRAPEMPEGKTLALTEENFPSESLLKYLKENFDNDKDGQVNTDEITYINLSGREVHSLAGIEHLNCLQSLSAWDTSLTDLNLSSNTVLTSLYVVQSSLTNIDISGCPYLEEVNLNQNSLTQIDVSKNRQLCRLDLCGNSLTSLDVSKNSKLKSLNVNSNAITGLDLTNNSKLQSLNCSYNPRMTELKLPAQREKIEEIRVMGNKLNAFAVTEMPNLKILEIDSGQGGITELDLTNNTKLAFLTVNNLFVKADWTKMTALETLYIDDWASHSTLEKLDLSHAVNLQDCQISMNSLKEIDVHGCAKLGRLGVSGMGSGMGGMDSPSPDGTITGGKLQKINLAGCIALSDLSCTNGELTALDVSGCIALKSLNCYNTKLETLDVTHNTALQSLYCSGNKLTTIDTSKNPALKWFTCSDNPIVSLDLSSNKAMLTDLTCINGSLTSLDAGENEVLENVQLDGQVFKASTEDLQQEPAARTKGEDFSGGLQMTENIRGAVSGNYVLNLARYGEFDPGKVKNLSSGTAVANGIMWKDLDSVPLQVTYEYDISNGYKLSGRTMPVTIQFGDSDPMLPSGDSSRPPQADANGSRPPQADASGIVIAPPNLDPPNHKQNPFLPVL